MTRTQYWFLNGASLLLAALIGFEIYSAHQLDRIGDLLQRAQTPLIMEQQSVPQLQHLLQRTAIGATRDPALKEMMGKYGFVLTAKPAAPPDVPAPESPPHP